MLVEQSKKEKKFIIIVGGKMSNANEEEKPLNKKRNHQYTRSHFGFLEELKKIDAHEKYVEEKLDSQEYREDCISKSILEKEYENVSRIYSTTTISLRSKTSQREYNRLNR